MRSDPNNSDTKRRLAQTICSTNYLNSTKVYPASSEIVDEDVGRGRHRLAIEPPQPRPIYVASLRQESVLDFSHEKRAAQMVESRFSTPSVMKHIVVQDNIIPGTGYGVQNLCIVTSSMLR